MTTAVLIILAVAGAGALASLASVRAQNRREAQAAQEHAAAEAERKLVQERPLEYVTREGTRHQANMRAWLDRRGVVVIALFFLSVLLNVEIFVALNGGDAGAAAVAKGIGASLLELVLAVVASHLIRHREPRSAAWQARFWSVLALLAITVLFVYHYAHARSQHAIGPRVAEDERLLVQVRTTLLPDGRPDPEAVSAANRKLEDDKGRLQEAENSDQAQSILFPLGEVLGGELAGYADRPGRPPQHPQPDRSPQRHRWALLRATTHSRAGARRRDQPRPVGSRRLVPAGFRPPQFRSADPAD